MDSKVVVIFAKPYDFTDEKTKENKKGITIQYITDQEFHYDSVPDTDGSMGTRIAKCSIAYSADAIQQLQMVPGLYDASFVMDVDSAGKQVLKPQSFLYCGAATLTCKHNSKIDKQ